MARTVAADDLWWLFPFLKVIPHRRPFNRDTASVHRKAQLLALLFQRGVESVEIPVRFAIGSTEQAQAGPAVRSTSAMCSRCRLKSAFHIFSA